MPRRTKYSEAKIKPILEALEDGCTRKVAYAGANISHETFYRWLAQYPAFSEAITRAEAVAEAKFTRRLSREVFAQDGDWRAAVEWLKRRRFEDWGDRKRVDVTDLSDTQLIALLEGTAGEGSEAEGALPSLSPHEP